MNLTGEQLEIVKAIQSGLERVLRVSGPAGSGKSVVVRELYKSSSKIVYCAPTGLAASLVGGQTVHKTFGMPSQYPLDPDIKATKLRQSDASTRYFGGKRSAPLVEAEWIVIDECSMLRADQLDFINSAVQHSRRSTKAFGGAGILLVGDDGQLPPVSSKRDSEALESWGYKFPFGISQARCLKGVKTYRLTRIFRQQSRAEGELFSRIRTGQQSNLDLRILNRCVGRPLPGSITLTPYRAIAKRVNLRELAKLHGQELEFATESKEWQGEDPVQSLKLRRGARVVIKANGSWKAEGDYQSCVNGDQGTFYGVDRYGRMLIDVDGKGMVNLPKKVWTQHKWTINQNAELEQVKAGEFKAFPVVLGWAMTIHSSQGSTIKKVYIDLPPTKPFATGLLYVAISRVTSMNGLRLSRQVRHSDILSAVHGEIQGDQEELSITQ